MRQLAAECGGRDELEAVLVVGELDPRLCVSAPAR